MKKGLLTLTAAALGTALLLIACSNTGTTAPDSKVKLDPSKPVSLTVWHYYNGAQQAAFDQLVSEFNATEGKDKGIYVEGYTYGSISDLEKAISDAVSGAVGAQSLPDIFSTYADTAYAVQKEGKLADLTPYFTKEEQAEYVDSYIKEGYFNDDSALYLFPVAKSTEIMMINATDWQTFADATGSSLDELSTLEGVIETAKRYYEWTDSLTPDILDDGKAFYGRDSMSNYFVLGMKQMGVDLFDVKDGEVTIQADKEKVRRLWDNYYVPYVNGYFASFGKFRSDDVKTGDILAYTGSSASAMYFPDQVITEDGSRNIDYMVMQPPVFEGGAKMNVQQGASMAVTKSDEQHEYAACEFLKWFTRKENNLRFGCESAYLPVRKDTNSMEALDEVIREKNLEVSDKAYQCMKSILSNYEDIRFYTMKSFENGYAARKILDYDLSDKAAQDKEKVDEMTAGGMSRSEAAAAFTTNENFERWYEDWCSKLNDTVYKNK